MTVTAASSGTHTPSVINTATNLYNVDAAGTYQWIVDTANMQAGDSIDMIVRGIILTSGTLRICYYGYFAGSQAVPIKESIPISNELTDAISLQFRFRQNTGTARAYDWKVLLFA